MLCEITVVLDLYWLTSGWILFIFGTNDHWHARVPHMWCLMTLTHIFKIIGHYMATTTATINFISCLSFDCLHFGTDSFHIYLQRFLAQDGVLCLMIFTPQPLRAPGYCRTPSGRAGGRAAGQTSPVNILTSIIFHGSFSNLVRTFITLRSRTSSIMEVLPH